MPASAVTPALREYLKVVVVKKLVVENIRRLKGSIAILFSENLNV